MDEVERLLRHLEEVTEEIQALKFRLSYLEDHRSAIRESIKAALSSPPQAQLTLNGYAHQTQAPSHKRGASMSLRLAAETVAEMGGDVDAQELADRLKISFDAARLRLARAARQGMLVRVKLGRYRAPTNASEVETLTAQTEPRERPSEPSNTGMVKVG